MSQYGSAFSGSVSDKQLKDTVPKALLALVNMILEGPSSQCSTDKDQEPVANKMSLTIAAQLLTFNSVKSVRKQRSGNIRHNTDCEVPLALYLGLKMHAETRKRQLVDCLFHFIIERFERDCAVCPPQLKEGLFTTGRMGNIDHNPSSTTAVDAFHGTGHSLCQHPTLDNPGTERPNLVLEAFVTEKGTGPLPKA